MSAVSQLNARAGSQCFSAEALTTSQITTLRLSSDVSQLKAIPPSKLLGRGILSLLRRISIVIQVLPSYVLI